MDLPHAAAKLDLALRAAKMGVWHLDIPAGLRTFDAQVCRLLGIDLATFAGTAEEFFARVHPDDRDRVAAALEQTTEMGMPYEVEYRAIWPDGSSHDICARGALARDETGEPVRLDGVIWDITAHKQAEEADERFRVGFEKGAVSQALLSLDGRFLRVNAALARMLGYQKSELVGKEFNEVTYPEDRSVGLRAFERLLGGEEVLRYEKRYVSREGAVVWVDANLALVRDGENRPKYFIGTCVDITERKRAENELVEMNRQLEATTARAHALAAKAQAASAAKSEFLANMSHEIRTPMNGMAGMIDLLLDTDLTEEQRRFAETARSSGESLLGIINDILDLSKIEAGKLSVESISFDVRALLDDVAGAMRMCAQAKGIGVALAISPEVPSAVRGDPTRLRQVLLNLIGNAVKFTNHGEVVVGVSTEGRTGPGPEPRTGAGRDSGVFLRFSVRDTGIGIASDKLDILFDKFTQVDASTTRRYGGTGLGLAISKRLAELMGGQIGVNSEVGRGSEFWFTARLQTVPEWRTSQDLVPARLACARVLIVDDSAASREILAAELLASGMRPVEAADGPAAMRLLYEALVAGDPFHVVLTDMQMPGMDGKTLGRILARDKRFAATKLVLVTSPNRHQDPGRFAEAGFAAYLVKPVRQKQLVDCLVTVLGDERTWQPDPCARNHSTGELRRYNVRVLFAEDDKVNQQTILAILGRLGLHADAASNGRDAIQALQNIPYDLVLMDLQMPEMDGLEATQAIRSGAAGTMNRAVPIIAMTAHAMQGDRDKCLLAGMDDYISKPVSTEGLSQLLEKWLARLDAAHRTTSPLADSVYRGTFDAGRPEAADLPVFADAALAERLMGDRALAQYIVDGFLDDIPRQLDRARAFLDAADTEGVERRAQAIEGAAATVGAETLASVAIRLQRAARAGDLWAARKLLGDLHQEFQRASTAMKTSSVLGVAGEERA